MLEELLDEKGLVSLNDGRGTRIDPVTGNESALDLTLISSSTAGTCSWQVWEEPTVDSDHYPVMCMVGRRVEDTGGDRYLGKRNGVSFRSLVNRGCCRWISVTSK